MPNDLLPETTIPAILRLLEGIGGLGLRTSRISTPIQTPSPGATRMIAVPTIRRYGFPQTERERKEKHLRRFGITELPPRGTGLMKTLTLQGF